MNDKSARALVINEHLADPVEDRIPKIRRLLTNREILLFPSTDEIAEKVEDIEIVFGSIPLELLHRAKSLKWIQLAGAGADGIAYASKNYDFVITNASGVHAIPISEHILALMFALARGLNRAIRRQLRHKWTRHDIHKAFELSGKTVLLIGIGAIGEAFANRAKSLGMNVIGIRRHPERGLPDLDRVLGPDSLKQELPNADFVVITVPGTDETRGMIGKRELSLMKPESYIFNIGRGGTIDGTALIDALERQAIAGAGLDVFEEEPLPEGSPLWEMENVIITSHYAGITPAYGDRLWEIFFDNLTRYLDAKPMRNLVDKELGY